MYQWFCLPPPVVGLCYTCIPAPKVRARERENRAVSRPDHPLSADLCSPGTWIRFFLHAERTHHDSMPPIGYSPDNPRYWTKQYLLHKKYIPNPVSLPDWSASLNRPIATFTFLFLDALELDNFKVDTSSRISDLIPENLIRELEKAYTGFMALSQTGIDHVVSSLRGSGPFGGDPNVKSIVLGMAAARAGILLSHSRSMGTAKVVPQTY